MRTIWLAVAALVACGKSKPSATAAGSGSGSGSAAAVAVVAAAVPDAAPDAPAVAALKPCPDDEAAKKLQATRWKIADGSTIEVECAAGHFPAPGWYLDTRWQHDDDMKEVEEVLAADGKTVIAKGAPEDLTNHQWEDSHTAVELGDLDGDGIDEIVISLTWEGHGTTSNSLHLEHLKGGALEALPSEVEGYSQGGLANVDPVPECNATEAVDATTKPARIVIDVTGGTPDASCLAKGKHVFELKAGKLVETTTH